MKSYKVHLIRHGLTEGNLKGQYIGATNLPVTTNGIKELDHLRQSGCYPEVRVFYTSPLLRCRQTLELLYPDCDPIAVPNLRECDFGEFEGKTADELAENPAYQAWTSGKLDRPPGGESTADFTARVCAGFGEMMRHLMTTGETEAAVITHGGVIMSILTASALPQKPFYSWMCGNGRGYTVRVTPSLYLRSGVIEVIGEIPPGAAGGLAGGQKELIHSLEERTDD